MECDRATSLITEVEAGRGIALATPILKLVTGKRLLYRPLTGTTEVLAVGIARATKGDVTPAGEKFCEGFQTEQLPLNQNVQILERNSCR